MILRIKRGNSIAEYLIVMIIIIAAALTMTIYLKRGVQGRWRDSVDQLGDQYSPGSMNGVVTHRIVSKANTRIQTVMDSVGTSNGYYTMRWDSLLSRETRNGAVQVGY